MTNAQIFTQAHIIAKSTRNLFPSYRGAFSVALRTIYAELRIAKAEKESLPKKSKATKVIVHWTEAPYVFFGREENIELPFSDFETISKAVAKDTGYNEGYCKTKITVMFDNGNEYTCRLDLAMGEGNDTCFTDHMNTVVKHPEYYGEQVKEFFNNYSL